MLDLNDPAWNALHSHCRTGREVAAMLRSYQEVGFPEREDLYEDLLDLGCGGEFYDSGYAAVPHLVRLAEQAPPFPAAVLLNTAAAAMYYAGREGSDPLDDRFAADFADARSSARRIANCVLAQLDDCPERRWLEAADIPFFEGDVVGYEKAADELTNQGPTSPPSQPR